MSHWLASPWNLDELQRVGLGTGQTPDRRTGLVARGRSEGGKEGGREGGRENE